LKLDILLKSRNGLIILGTKLLTRYAAYPYNYVVSNYTNDQRNFIDMINWENA